MFKKFKPVEILLKNKEGKEDSIFINSPGTYLIEQWVDGKYARGSIKVSKNGSISCE